MRSPIAILLLLALCGSSSATIYFMRHIDTVQVQANLVLFAHENQDPTLLYELVDFDGTVDRYLASLHKRTMNVQVQEAREGPEETITGIVLVSKGGESYHAKLHLVPSSTSPTGYKIDRAVACKNQGCRNEEH